MAARYWGGFFMSALSDVFAVPQRESSSHEVKLTTPRQASGPSTIDSVDDLVPGARATLNLLPEMAWMQHVNGRAAYFNRAWTDYTGVVTDNSATAGWLRHVHPEDRDRANAAWTDSQHHLQPVEIDCRLRDRSGSYRWFKIRACAHLLATGQTVWCGTCSDIDHAKRRELSLAKTYEQQNNMLDVSVDCIKIVDTAGALVQINRAGREALGVPAFDTRLGMKWLELLPPEVRRRGQRALDKACHGIPARFPGLSVIPGHKPQHWDNILMPMRAETNEVTGVLCVSREVTLQREAEERLRIASEVDALTGLLNRRAFKSRLNRTISRCRRKGTVFGLLLADIDHFKQVNDTLGHAAGDYLLRRLAKRLAAAIAGQGFAARLGGDEFAIVIDGVEDAADVRRVAERLLDRATFPASYSGKRINWGLSAGCAIFPSDGKDGPALMKSADTALHELKAAGRGGLRLFDNRMVKEAERASAQRSMAKRIVCEDRVEPHYQSKVRLDDNSLVGFQALLRWRDDDQHMHLPCSVSEGFKDYELATGIARLMHAKVLRDLAEWLQRGLAAVPISITTSPVEFLYDDFAESLLQRLDAFAIPPSLVEIEVTEQALVERGSEFVARALRMLKASGVHTTLGGFGTGYSSFTHLGAYPVSCLKIDPSFVSRMVSEPPVFSIVKAISMLGASLSLGIFADGIETVEQQSMLRSAGCAIGQGSLLGQTMTAAEARLRLAGIA
ncbi:EAL domain-containing protein [Ralstonia pickettii]|uniref:EAL domain-containing protein n=2 Tax=Ralstonia pickettii TaxID=329 RepID=A0A7X2HSD0_RALPI|nr:EAL domain-containing protein [Ralstonia pickettii]